MWGDLSQKTESKPHSDFDQMAGFGLVVAVVCVVMLFIAKFIPIALVGAILGFFIYTARFQPTSFLQIKTAFRNTAIIALFFFIALGLPIRREDGFVGALFYSKDFWQLCREIANQWNGMIPQQKLFRSLVLHQISPLLITQYVWLSVYAAFGFALLFLGLGAWGKIRSGVSDATLQILSLPSGLFAKLEALVFHFWIRLGRSLSEKGILPVAAALLGLGYASQRALAPRLEIFEFYWLAYYLAYLPFVSLGLSFALSLSDLGNDVMNFFWDHKESQKKSTQPGFQLGKTFSGRAFRLSEKNLNYHVEIVAPTGSGKTNLLKSLISDRIQKGHGVIFLDFKADFEIVSWAYRASLHFGREKDLRLFSLSDRTLSVPYNPLKLGDATAIQSALMNSMNWSEEYYRGIASVTLSTLIRSLCEYRDKTKENFNLGHIYQLLDQPVLMRVLADRLSQLGGITAPKLSELASRIEKPSERSNLMGLLSNLNQILFSSAGELLSQDTSQGSFDFREATQKSQIVVMLMNSLKLKESAQTVGKIILQDLMSFVGDHYARIDSVHPKPITLIIDEFAAFAMPNFIEFMDRARGAGIGIVLAHQARADLKSISPEFQERIEANSNTTLVSGVKNSADAEYYSGMLGTKTTKKETLQKKQGLFWDESTGMKSVRDVEEFVLHPNQLRELHQGELFAISRTIDPQWGLVRVNKAPEFLESQIPSQKLTEQLKSIRENYLNQKEFRSLDLSPLSQPPPKVGLTQKHESSISAPTRTETWS